MKLIDRIPKLGFEGSVFLITCTLAATFLGLVLPFSILIIFDRIVPNQAMSSLWILYTIIVFSIGLDYLVKQAEGKFVSKFVKRFEIKMSSAVFDSICHANIDRLHAFSNGEYLERIQTIGIIKDYFAGDWIKAMINTLVSAVTIVIIALIDLASGLTLLGSSLILLAIARHMSKKKNEQLALKSDAEGLTSSKVIEIVSNPMNLKASAMEFRMENLMDDLVKQREQLALQFERVESEFGLRLTLIQQVSVSLVVVHCALSVIDLSISQGVMAAIILLTNRYFAPYQQIMYTISRWKINNLYLERLNQILDLDESQVETEEITLKSIEVPALDMQFNSGTLYVLNGKSGSGKSYISQVICKELHTTNLDVFADGKVLNDINYTSWRKMVMHVDRNSGLVEGTIIDNITCFQPALYKAAYSLCEALNIKNKIDGLKLGFYTELKGSSNTPFSRQVGFSLCIIRAMLSSKSLIIIDDIDLVYDKGFGKHLVACLRPRIDAMTCILVSNKLHGDNPDLLSYEMPPSFAQSIKRIEPSANKEPSAGREPSAGKEPSANRKPSAPALENKTEARS